MAEEPILSPRQDTVEGRAGSPLELLAVGYPPGAAASNVMLLVLSAWLFVSPYALGYADHVQALSDRVSAISIAVLAVASLITRRPWVAWIAGCVGLWLIAAPVVLWSPTIGAYLSSTIAGVLIAAEGLLAPMSRRLPAPETPEGWSYNPSAWSQRIPVIILSIVSFLPAAYMAFFQLGYVERVWDPVFGDGTMRVLTSDISRAWPVSDAALGAATYLIDLVMVCAGDARRWRTMPWLVIAFGVLIIPVGIVSIVLIILQPLAVGAWCAWCIVTAFATLAMIPLALDEVAATLQLLRRVRRRGGSWWTVLWRGSEQGATAEPLTSRAPSAMPPWPLWVMAAAGVWVVIEPAVLGAPGLAADSAYLAGSLVVVVAVIAMSEVARAVRFVAIPIGTWILVSPWLFGEPTAARLSGIVAGVIVMVCAMYRGTLGERRGAIDYLVNWPLDRGHNA